MNEFEAPQDRFVQTVTVLVVITFALLLLIFATADNTMGLVFTAAIGFFVLGTSYLLAPSGYTMSESEIIIRRKAGSVRIPLSQVRSVHQDSSACSPWSVRTFGVSGLFGYFGRFYTAHLGHHIMYVTDRHKAVVIEADKMYVVSPDDPQQFVQIAQARLEAISL